MVPTKSDITISLIATSKYSHPSDILISNSHTDNAGEYTHRARTHSLIQNIANFQIFNSIH